MRRRGFLTTLLGAVLAPAVVRLSTPKPKLLEFPIALIRRIHPDLLASELVKVQPMDGPTGLIFHMNFVSTSSPRRRVEIPFCTASTPSRWKITL